MSKLANYELALTFFLACCAKVTLLLACAWITAIALRRRSSAAQRHHVWAAAILCSLALPLFAPLLPAWHSAAFGSAAALWTPMHANATGSRSFAIPSTIINVAANTTLFNKVASVALLTWIIGFSFVFLRLLAGLAR